MMLPTQSTERAGAAVLHELGEWAALGFYEGLALPWPRAYGLAYRRLYELMPIRVPDDALLLPCEPLADARTRDAHGCWTATSLICDFNHDRGLRVNREIAEEKQARFPQHAGFIDTLVADLTTRLPHFGGYTHSNPDMRRVVNEGFLAIEAELDAQLARIGHDADRNDREAWRLLLALKDYALGVRAFHARTCEALAHAVEAAEGERKIALSRIATSFAHAFLHPADTFLEGLLAVHFTWMLDGCDSIGRFDQVLGDLFTRDVRQGTLDLAFARRLLDELWQNFQRLNGWNLQIGGYTPDGRDGLNALTLECLAACRRNRALRPNVAFRITKDTPDSALQEALAVLAEGSGRPALYNDDLYVETLRALDLGLTPEDAREIGFGGCTETMIAGMSNVGSIEIYFNLAKALELALHDGYDPVKQSQEGPHTGRFVDFPDFPAFFRAVQRQIQYMTDALVARNRAELLCRFHQGDPKLYRTLFTRDCVKTVKSFEAGGARYNWAVVSYQGTTNVIDSLAAIRQCVFAAGQIDKAALLRALQQNYAGCEEIRLRLLAAPKFGNDHPEVDDTGRELLAFAFGELMAHETPRGGRYLPCCIQLDTYLGAGRQVGATPDGRAAYAPLNDSISAVAGRDISGPTALLHSVATLPLASAIGTPVLNLRFQRQLMQSSAGLHGLVSMVRTFFAQGGMQVQFSVISQEEMLAAQREPEQYRDLIVRIGGFSEYFNNLPRELQDSVIARTEYGTR